MIYLIGMFQQCMHFIKTAIPCYVFQILLNFLKLPQDELLRHTVNCKVTERKLKLTDRLHFGIQLVQLRFQTPQLSLSGLDGKGSSSVLLVFKKQKFIQCRLNNFLYNIYIAIFTFQNYNLLHVYNLYIENNFEKIKTSGSIHIFDNAY